MSGIGFQKLQGQGTTAFEQIQKTTELISEIQELNYPDIYKMARMFAPENELIPVTKFWDIGGTNQTYTLNFNGRYLGYFRIHHTHNGIGEVPAEQSQLVLFDGETSTHYSLLDKYTDGTHHRATEQYNYTGFGSSLHLFKPRSQGVNFNHSVQVYFIGFQLGESLPTPVVVIPDEVIPIPQPPDVNVQVKIISRPNGVQPFKATFGTLNIEQNNGTVNYNQVATTFILNGFDTLPFTYRYYLNGVLNSDGSTLNTKTLDVYHSNTHLVEIEYVQPVLSAEYLIKHVFTATNHRLTYDDNTYDLVTAYKNITHPTRFISISNEGISNPVTSLFRLRANVMTSIGTIPQLNRSIENGDLLVSTNTSGEILNVFNFLTSSVVINNSTNTTVNAKSSFSKVSNISTRVTNNTGSTIKLAVLSNATYTYHTITNTNFVDIPHSGVAQTAVTIIIYS